MRRNAFRSPGRWLFAAAIPVVASCTDSPTTVRLPGAPHAVIQPIAVEETDSWVSVGIEVQSTSTVTTSEPFTDPATGASTNTLSVSSAPEQIVLNGGYDGNGEFVGEMQNSLDPDPNADPATQIAVTRFNADQVTNYDGYGAVMSPTLSDGSTAPNVTSDDLFYTNGELVDGVVIDDPTLYQGATYTGGDAGGSSGGSTGGTGGGGDTPIREQPMEMSVQTAGGQVKRHMERPDAYTLVVNDDVNDAETGVFAPQLRADVSGTAPQGGTTHVRRTFKRHGQAFVLDNIRIERTEEVPGGRAEHVQTMRYTHVKWHRNRARDAARLRKRGLAPPDDRASWMPPSQPVRAAARFEAPRPRTAAGSMQTTFGPPEAPLAYQTGGTGKSLVLQHGFAQGFYYYANSRALQDIDQHLRYDALKVSETDYGAVFQTQAASLAGQVPARPNILVGHSNGGIVARELAHQRPDLTEGVITVSSPHHGVPLLRLEGKLAALVAPYVWTINTVGCKWFGSHSVCSVFDNGADALFSRIVGGDGRAVPVWSQERYDDPYLGPYLWNLNHATEQFNRVGIEQHTRQRWLLWRVLGDQNLNCGSGASYYPCGRNLVADLDKWYGGLRAATVVRWTWNPFKLAGRIIKAALAGTVMLAVNAIDGVLSYSLGGGHESDGLVPFDSQRYPNQNGPPVVVNGADSHNASAYSPPAVTALRSTLQNRFGVPPQ